MTDTEVICIGGGVSAAGDYLIERVAKYYKEYAFHACKNTKIVRAELGNDAGMYGAASSLASVTERCFPPVQPTAITRLDLPSFT
jgi:predicted NBD/HSP70 family sugar kinase